MNKRTWIKIAVLILFIVMVWWGLKLFGVDFSQINPDRIRSFVLDFGVWAPVVYLLVYGQPIIPLPASVLTITGGLAFGPAWGTLAALCGATIRACSEFLVARLLGRDTVSKLVSGALRTVRGTLC